MTGARAWAALVEHQDMFCVCSQMYKVKPTSILAARLQVVWLVVLLDLAVSRASCSLMQGLWEVDDAAVPCSISGSLIIF
jgi:hypothetical protein